MRVVVTRPPVQAAEWVARLQALGVEAVALPLIGIGAIEDPGPVRSAWASLDAAALVVFVSSNAVHHFFALRPAGATWPPGTQAGSTGPGTGAALRHAGLGAAQIVEPDADAPNFDSEALWAKLALHDWSGRRVVVVRGEDGRDWLASTLREHGAVVEFVAAYRRLPPSVDAAGRAVIDAALSQPATHLWSFSSSEAIGHLRALAPRADWSASAAVASHPRIAQTARDAGFGRVEVVPPDPVAVAALARRAPIQSAPQ
jgi:uroporphyrinogen-III synthase